VHGAWQREVSTKRSGTSFRLATRGMRQAISGVELDYDEDSTQLWIGVLRRCFVGGPITSVACIGITRGHLRL